MIIIRYFGAGLFIVLAGTANILFALQLGHTMLERAFWAGVAIASVTWTVCGFDTVTTQWRDGRRGRAAAALGLLLCALGYDVLSARALSRAEQMQMAAAQATYAHRMQVAAAEIGQHQAALGALPAGSIEQAQAAIGAVTVDKALCAAVTGPNKYSRAQADRMRIACRQRAEALQALAAAQARQRTSDALRAAQRRLAALKASPPPSDARAELLPAAWVAWAPVLLITSGALFSAFAAGSPPPAQRKAEQAPEAPADTPEAGLPALEPVKADPGPETRLLHLAQADDDAIAPLVRRDDGFVKGAQRAIAKKVGASVTAVNRALQSLHQQGAIQLDTKNGTAFRLAG